jgi:hypothetical protein
MPMSAPRRRQIRVDRVERRRPAEQALAVVVALAMGCAGCSPVTTSAKSLWRSACGRIAVRTAR